MNQSERAELLQKLAKEARELVARIDACPEDQKADLLKKRVDLDGRLWDVYRQPPDPE